MTKPYELADRLHLPPLDADSAPDVPWPLVQDWMDAALQAGLIEPTAMALATVSPAGRPSVRMVLLKGHDERGFVFFTNERSRKGLHLSANPHAALTFWWDRLERQLRIEGTVERTTPAESDAYFASRPYESQIGAWASPQSEPIRGRAEVEARYEAVRRQYPAPPVPRPPHWGGYRLVPASIEFWQGRPGRLHDRLAYTRDTTDRWQRTNLAP